MAESQHPLLEPHAAGDSRATQAEPSMAPPASPFALRIDERTRVLTYAVDGFCICVQTLAGSFADGLGPVRTTQRVERTRLVKISAILPNSGSAPMVVGIDVMARAAEETGAHALWVSDHILLQATAIEGYPYADDGRISWNPEDAYFEALSTCAYVAGVTTRCRIGTAVLVLPQRHVLQTAKELATIDNLSGGRLSVGIGTGWNRGEMEALGHRFETRGARLDEMITVLRDCWMGRTTRFEGAELTVPGDLLLQPTPLQSPGPPLLLGGMSRPAIRRAARSGDGWLALAFADRWDGDRLAEAGHYYQSQVDLAPRTPAAPLKVLKLHCSPTATDLLPSRLSELADLGFNEVAVELPWNEGIDEASSVLAGLVASWD